MAVAQQDKEKEVLARKVARVNALQWAPVRSLPMNLFIMWMTGNEIQIFSIMVTGMAVYSPFQALAATNATFKPFASDPELRSDVWRCKLVYVVMCFVALGVGLWKLQNMGLLPTGAADWVDHSPSVYGIVSTGVVV